MPYLYGIALTVSQKTERKPKGRWWAPSPLLHLQPPHSLQSFYLQSQVPPSMASGFSLASQFASLLQRCRVGSLRPPLWWWWQRETRNWRKSEPKPLKKSTRRLLISRASFSCFASRNQPVTSSKPASSVACTKGYLSLSHSQRINYLLMKVLNFGFNCSW